MSPTTPKGAPYPASSSANNVPADLQALATWADQRPGIETMTTAQRDALTGANVWAGRTIFNTTTGRHEVNPVGTAGAANWSPAATDTRAMTAAQRTALAGAERWPGRMVWESDTRRLVVWNGSAWRVVPHMESTDGAWAVHPGPDLSGSGWTATGAKMRYRTVGQSVLVQAIYTGMSITGTGRLTFSAPLNGSAAADEWVVGAAHATGPSKIVTGVTVKGMAQYLYVDAPTGLNGCTALRWTAEYERPIA